MNTRLQILLKPKEYKTLKNLAKSLRLSLGEWARQALRSEINKYSSKSSSKKLAIIRKYSKYQYPTASIEQMNQEISQGYL